MASRVFEVFARLWVDLRHGRGHLIDTITGLSDKDKKLIRDSKEILLAKPQETGVNILLKLFEKYPQYLKLYPFKDLTPDELKSDKAFLEQSTKLMNAVETWINKLNDPEELRIILVQTEEESSFPKEYFLDFQETFIEYLVPLVDNKTLEAWEKLIKFAMKTMVSKMK